MAAGNIVKTTVFAILAMLAAQPVQAQMWCLRDFGDAPYKNCVFPSAEQCFLAVRIGGGVCERDQREPGKGANALRRPARRSDAKERW
jgi:hypothetical protein